MKGAGFLNYTERPGQALSVPELQRTRVRTQRTHNTRTMPTRAQHVETLIRLQRFPPPMDRAEALHAPSYDISGSWKNTPGENELVIS